MNSVKISVLMSDLRCGREYVSMATINVQDHEIRDCGPIDYPATDTNHMTAELFCTPVKVREFVEQSRKRLAHQITEQILKCLGADDTVMGYKMRPKASQKKYRDGEPCGHPGCLHHVTHPCEGCWRKGWRS